jgi:hypothetical protein
MLAPYSTAVCLTLEVNGTIVDQLCLGIKVLKILTGLGRAVDKAPKVMIIYFQHQNILAFS